jgi:hypothetical protein
LGRRKKNKMMKKIRRCRNYQPSVNHHRTSDQRVGGRKYAKIWGYMTGERERERERERKREREREKD